MADENSVFDPEEEGSLEKFEEELEREEKKQTRVKLLAGTLVFLIIGGGSYYAYTNFFATSSAPTVLKAEQTLPTPKTPQKEKTAEVKPSKQTAKVQKKERKGKSPAGIKEELIKERTLKAGGAVTKTSREKFLKKTKPQTRPEETTKKGYLPKPAVSDGKTYTMQVGLFRKRKNAESMGEKLKELNLTPTLRKITYTAKTIRVYTGFYPYRELAIKAADNLLKQGLKPRVALTGAGRYELEMGRFKSEAHADSLVRSLEDMQFVVRVAEKKERLRATIVRLENIQGGYDLEEIKETLKRKNIRFLVKSR
ncbi:MAG: hypothetical protein IEMM0002_0729 [bacterium]|nr:MAG: hypothetical protein IEMM0002_0729 [bacterium]